MNDKRLEELNNLISKENIDDISEAIVQASNKLLEAIKSINWTQIAIVELKNTKAELETYKKALEIACEDIDVICQSYKTVEECKKCPFTCRHADLVESYLMKAREEDV